MRMPLVLVYSALFAVSTVSANDLTGLLRAGGSLAAGVP